MRDAPDREKWMASLLLRGAEEAADSMGAGYVNGAAFDWSNAYTIATMQFGGKTLHVAVPHGKALRIYDMADSTLIAFEPESN